jgi:2-dehydro-3-deoxyphosphooctonate aldolase (KDO 8-P synthase)
MSRKGQFLDPAGMANVAEKIASTGNDRIMLTERGTTFGYNGLVADMRSLPIMARTGYPVIMDATHAVAFAGRAWATVRAGSASLPRCWRGLPCRLGIAGVFLETHQDPDNAPSDGPNMIRLNDMPG